MPDQILALIAFVVIIPASAILPAEILPVTVMLLNAVTVATVFALITPFASIVMPVPANVGNNVITFE